MQTSILNSVINKKAVEASFSKAAKHYDHFADLQREVGYHLMNLMANTVKDANSILDLGCGTGYFSALFNIENKHAHLTCFDLSSEMLKKTAQRGLTRSECVQGDIDNLPFPANQFDLIFSNLVLQWSEQLDNCLGQTKNALNKGGKLCFSTLLNGSLIELQQAWKEIDNNPHINDFLTTEKVQDALLSSGFNHVRLTTKTHVKKYSSVIEVMKALKGIGANHVHNGSTNRTMGRQLLSALDKGYSPFIDKNGLYNLSYEVCYVIAEVNKREKLNDSN
jgi:malonyl-CoA O-methyltransferase